MIVAKYKDLSIEIENMLNEMSDMDKLPGVFVLAKKFNSAPQTISKALKFLSEKGKVTINGTKGTFATKSADRRVSYKRIGILDTMAKGFSQEEKNSLMRFCARQGYELFTIEYNNISSKNGISFISSLPADGFILNYKTITPELAISLRQSGKQFVSINQIFDIPGISWVDFNTEATIEKALKILAKTGKKRIALISYRWGIKEHHEGVKNIYKKCMTEISGFDENLWCAEKDYLEYYKIYGEDAYIELGKQSAEYLMKLKNPPDSMIVLSKQIVSGVYRTLSNLGCKVPEDISLLVYSTEDGKNIHDAVSYSTIGYPLIGKVQRAIEALTELIENPDVGPVQEQLPFNFKKGQTI